MKPLSHVDAKGKARMVDVSAKEPTRREAVARAEITLSPECFRLVRRNAVAKGDVLAVAQMAGICAAKKTWDLIPLCHPLSLDSVDVELTLDARGRRVLISARARTRSATGVEMEAMVAASIAALTVYDMVKGVDRQAHVSLVRLEEKSGGRSGQWRRTAARER